MKKIVILVCVLCLFVALILTACNTNDSKNDIDNSQDVYLPYEIDKTGCIQRFFANETNSVDIVIPATYSIDENGKVIFGTAYQITSIGSHCFANNNLIESVYIPDTVISIKDCAFYNCVNLTTINISQNIETIGENAFELCHHYKEWKKWTYNRRKRKFIIIHHTKYNRKT